MIPENNLQEFTDKSNEFITGMHNYVVYALIHGQLSAGAKQRRDALHEILVVLQSNAYLHGLDDGLKTVKFVT